MRDLYVRDIVKYAEGTLLIGDMNKKLGSIITDSRLVEKDFVYVGIKGERMDGNAFYQDAYDKGASVFILNKDYVNSFEVFEKVKSLQGVSVVLVDDSIVCLQKLAEYKRSLLDIPVIAITGSVGKTSCKDLVYSVVSKKYKTHRTIGNYNNHLGVPLTILSLNDEDVMIVEMGMNHLGEISVLSKIAKPTIGIITNVGTAHIGNLGSRENILKAKLEILDGMQKGSTIILNEDSDMMNSTVLSLDKDYQVEYISIDKKSTYQAISLEESVFGSNFQIANEDSKREVFSIGVGGRGYVYHALMAYVVGKKLNLTNKEIQEGFLDYKLSSHRLEKKINAKGVVVIDDTYNANFDSMKASIELLGKVSDKRKIAVIGDMLELGEYSKKLHEDIGEILAKNHLDKIILVGKEVNYTKDKLLALGFNALDLILVSSEAETYSYLDELLMNGDIVLAKASHGIHLDRVVDKIMS